MCLGSAKRLQGKTTAVTREIRAANLRVPLDTIRREVRVDNPATPTAKGNSKMIKTITMTAPLSAASEPATELGLLIPLASAEDTTTFDEKIKHRTNFLTKIEIDAQVRQKINTSQKVNKASKKISKKKFNNLNKYF